MSSSDSEDECIMQLAGMVRSYRKEGVRAVEFARLIPQLLKEFYVDEHTFHDRFGMHPREFEELHSMIEGKILRKHSSFRDNIGTRERLAIVLRFLSCGGTMDDLSKHYGIPYSSVPIMIREVCKTLSNHLMPIMMPPPTRKMWEKNVQDFWTMYDMPNCIAAIEGKNLFVHNQKIVLLALVDAHDRFIMVDVGRYRLNVFRGNVLDKSIIGQGFQKNQYHVPPNKPITKDGEPLPLMILGSSFFPPKPYLMIKYSEPECVGNEARRVFNTRLNRAKVSVNRAMIRLRAQWRVFQNAPPVHDSVIESIVQTCCCLHNLFIRNHGQVEDHYRDLAYAITEERLESLRSLVPADSQDIRDKFKAYFLSEEGQVPWQWRDIMQTQT